MTWGKRKQERLAERARFLVGTAEAPAMMKSWRYEALGSEEVGKYQHLHIYRRLLGPSTCVVNRFGPECQALKVMTRPEDR